MSNNPSCEFVPSYIALTHFNSVIQDYYEVERIITNYLNTKNIQYIYDAEWCIFTCTQIYDVCDERIDNISIYWDDNSKQHIVEVRRIKGDTLFHCSLSDNFHKIFEALNDLFSQQKPMC